MSNRKQNRSRHAQSWLSSASSLISNTVARSIRMLNSRASDWASGLLQGLTKRGKAPSARPAIPPGRPPGRGRPPAIPVSSGRPPGRPPGAPRPQRQLSAQEVVTRNVLLFFAITVGAFLLNVVVLSGPQHLASQQKLGNAFRAELEAATAPTSEGDANLVLLPNGVPVAYLEIPSIGVHEYVVEGTDAGSLMTGPGHRRDTVLPGQAGTSVIMGRAASFGGPFSGIGSLQPGDTFSVVTGQGFHTYQVIGTRYAGDPGPAVPGVDASRLVLETARGLPYLPAGVLYVDAQMIATSKTYPGSTATTPCPAVSGRPTSTGPSASTHATPLASSSSSTSAQPSSSAKVASQAPSPGDVTTPTGMSSQSPVATMNRMPVPCSSPSTTGSASPIPSIPSATPYGTPLPTSTTGAASTVVSGKSFRPSAQAYAAGARYTSAGTLPLQQREMATDLTTVWALVFALQFLLIVEIASVWALRRFGPRKTWIVAIPALVMAALFTSDQLVRLIPNLT